jgi:branched-chain amino acid transport system permease protein
MGGVYAINAVGLSLIFGVMRVTNFAHGEFLMVAMFLSYIIISLTGMDQYLAVIVCAVVLFVIGFFFQKTVINKLLEKDNSREPLSILLFTAGLGMVLSNLAQVIFGANPKVVNTKYSDKTFEIGNMIVSEPRLYAFIIAGLCTGSLYWFLFRTETGRALRATSQNRAVAKLMGINEKLIFCIAFGLGLLLVGVAGALLVPFYSVFPTVGSVFGLRSFIIVVLGGMGSIPGALLGGLIIGVVEAVAGQFLSASYAEIIVFALFISILLFKPSGLLSTEKE